MRVNPNLSSIVNSGIAGTAQALQDSVVQLSSGLRVQLPSDDPTAAAANLRSVAASARVDSYTANSEALLAQNQMADSVLSDVVQALTQAVALGTQGANGSLNQQDRSSAATQVQALLQQVVADANTKFGSKSLFSGTPTSADAFVADTTSPSGYSYQGTTLTSGAAIGDGIQVPTGIAGDQVFSTASADVLGSLSNLVHTLTTGTTSAIAAATADISNAIHHVGEQRVVCAGITNEIQTQETYLSREKVSLTAQQQQLTGVDMATAIEQLTQAQTAHSAMLAAAGKVLSTSLLNYLNPAGA